MRVLTGNDAPAAAPKLGSLTPSVTPPSVKATKTETMSKDEWAAKDLLKVKGGVSHDAATITASLSAMKTVEEVLALYDRLYDHILARVRE